MPGELVSWLFAWPAYVAQKAVETHQAGREPEERAHPEGADCP